MDNVNQLIGLAQGIVGKDHDFFRPAGPGDGNTKTNAFMRELQHQAEGNFKEDHSEQRICGDTKFAVDFYFREEATIVEVALGLKNSNTEFEKDILKALMAKETGQPVNRLLFLSKPGAVKRHSRPGSCDMIEWVKRNHQIQVDIKELYLE